MMNLEQSTDYARSMAFPLMQIAHPCLCPGQGGQIFTPEIPLLMLPNPEETFEK